MKNQLILEYYNKIKSANKELTKKEAFKDLLNRLYAGDKEILKLIDKITLGAESTIVNIPRKDKLHKGSADTLYNKVLIEFENNLNTTLNHAKEQLAGYLLGLLKKGEGYNFTLIASDFITWKIFAPSVECIEKIESLNEDELILNEIESTSFTLTERNIDDFYFWLDRFLFKEEKIKATLKRIEESFGYQSNVFIESFRHLFSHFNNAKKYGEVQVAFEQWRKFLSIAYGSFDATENNFLIHTYLSVFSKLLAYAVVSNDDYIDDNELKTVIDGSMFHKFNIRNFVDDDFFHWVKNERDFNALKGMFRVIAQEISTFDFNDVDEDILKGVYQELIDLDTRHALGEYYTPDWLCERILKEFNFTKGETVLDPACGSGSFLIAAVHRFRELNPAISVDEVNSSIYGIDIHPLSVQIAKTNMLLALGKDVVNARVPIHLNIILANTLLAPDGVEDLFGTNFKMNIDKETLELSSQILNNVKIFDQALEISEDLAGQTFGTSRVTIETFNNILSRQIKNGGFNKLVVESFYKIYESLCKVKQRGRDSIWKFIVQNLYKPYFLANKFNYVIGNPPWFTYSSIKNEEYQNILNALAEKFKVKPERVANFPHLEIAAIFLAYCSSYFLKENGNLAFVLPRSFFSADHHDNTRSGKAEGFKLNMVWDFNDVSPLFRVPTSVLFAVKYVNEKNRKIPQNGINGITFSGRLTAHNCKYSIARELLNEENSKFYYAKQGGSSALTKRKYKTQKKVNPYKSAFRQGATIVPRSFYFVELTQEIPNDFDDRIINIKTSEAIKPDAKMPWKEIELQGKIESRFLFRTALSKSILPFTLYKPDLVVLPITIDINEQNLKKINLHSADELLKNGFINAAKWFKNAENIWDIHKTENNKNMSLENYLNWQNKLTSQDLNAPYVVIYNSSAVDANSTVVVMEELDLHFLIESKAYSFKCHLENEAYYLTSILNSSTPNQLMKDFQTKGLWGARDVHKKILDIYFPKYDEKNGDHVALAELSKACHTTAKQYIEENPPQQNLNANRLGRIRGEIKKHLSQEMKSIDKIVKKIIG
jgi:hypothetical protein